MNTEHVKSHGYHFTIGFMPVWKDVLPIVVGRARRLGYAVGDDGNELTPASTSLSFAGTWWPTFVRGGLRFSVTAFRPELRASVMKTAGAVGRDATHCFDLANPGRLGGLDDVLRTEQAVGLWIRQGSLVLLATEQPKEADETIAFFDMWQGLDQLWRLSTDQHTDLVMTSEESPARNYTPPQWAEEFESMRVRVFPAETRAILRHRHMTVTLSVYAIEAEPVVGPIGEHSP